MSSDYNAAMHGDPSKQFTWMPMPSAPIDYLNAANLVKREAYESVQVTSASMTGSPQAGTASQENLINEGAQTTAADIRAVFEDALAELALKSLMMFLEYANEEEIKSYLGPEALLPRPSKELPTLDPVTKQMVPAPPLPSIYEAMSSTDLIGEKLECRFTTTNRGNQFMRIKSLQDFLATVNLVRDKTNTPYVDLAEVIGAIARELDIEVSAYERSESEVEAETAMMTTDGGEPGAEGDDPAAKHSDSRKANGQRGAPASPGSQSRGRDPSATAQAGASGNGFRRANSPNT